MAREAALDMLPTTILHIESDWRLPKWSTQTRIDQTRQTRLVWGSSVQGRHIYGDPRKLRASK